MPAGTVGLQPPKYGGLNDQKFWDWLAMQPLEQQAQLAQQAGVPAGSKTVRGKLREARARQFASGQEVPGVSATGYDPSNPDASYSGRADRLLGQNIVAGQELEDQLSALGVEDYAYDPAMEQGAGYSPVDRYEYADPNALPGFEAALEEQAINQARTDTTGVDAQKDVLGEYASLYAQGGLNAIDRARLEQARRTRAAQGRSAEEAIMADMEERGRAGSNAELLARQQAQQGATNARSMDDLQTMALGLQRRDALLRDQAGLGGQVQSAQDVIDQFNAVGERGRQARNTEREQMVREARFGESAGRERENAAAQRGGINIGFEADTGRDIRNTAATNESRRFNVSPNQGRRGMIGDRSAIAAATAAARQAAAARLEGRQMTQDEADAAEIDRWVNAGSTAVGAGVNLATAGMRGPR